MLNITKRFNQLLWTLLFSGVSALSVLGQETPNNESSLLSPETGIDYTPLQEDLQRQRWLEANETTTTLMLKSVDRQQQGWIPQEDVQRIACWDLRTIDDLWRQYSGGRFGFTVQFPIFVETGNRPGRLVDTEAYDNFGTRIGWREDEQWIQFKYSLDYSLDAPVGHLPNPRPEYQITGGRLNYTALTQRMVDCGLVAYSDPRQPINYQP
ncbi:MAG: GUN4 domain-containing protein [Crocosphaera sp.]|nr:GUN4 domain-containing protein [Crocosphaera sp.]